MKQQIEDLIRACGFDAVGEFMVSNLRVLPEVRDMCAVDKCRAYDKSWSCPPHCGSLAYFEDLFTHFTSGFAFQTIGTMEDDFDYEAIPLTSGLHSKRFNELVDRTMSFNGEVLLLSAGSCLLCETCTCPDESCRYPDRMRPSMEAAGLLVNEVCTAATIAYNNGKNTMTFTSCILF